MRTSSPILFLRILAAGILLVTACQNPLPERPPQQEALDKLDKTLQEGEHINQTKAASIKDLQERLQQTEDGREQYRTLKSLYLEYARYNLDTALFYVHRKEELARAMNDRALINDALKDKADRYVISGMYRYAEEALDAIDLEEDMSPPFLVAYYRSLITLHHGLKLTNKDPMFNERLDQKEHYFRNKIFDVADSTMLYYYTYRAENEMEKGQTEAARKELQHYLQMHPTSSDELSILYYCLAKTYRLDGDIDQALTHYAISAHYDLREGVRSSRSLIQTARMAMQKGQTDRAFSYITRAYDDATQADARICLEEIAGFMPEIISSYTLMTERRINDITLIVILLALIIAIFVTALFFLRRYHAQILRANKVIQDINEDLNRHIIQVKEANERRENSLGDYVAMFTSHINSLEEYRSSIRMVAKSKDIDEITHMLRSDDFIDSKREILLKEFDRTFLTIFPDFVQQLNALLQDGQHIGEGLPEGKLTNELRIFALIRLGVNESAQIARFLKKSPSTVYNYRVKLRNAAICPNDEFEQRLMEIGKN